MTSFVPLDEAIARRRKQESTSVNHVYPLTIPTELDHSYSFGGMDPMATSFDHYLPTATSMAMMDNNQALMHQPQTDFSNNSGSHSRRHSLAIGELDYQYPIAFNGNSNNADSFLVKQEPLDTMHWGNMDFNNMLLDGDPFASFSPSLSSYSSGNSMDQVTMLPHQRTMSLRLENTSPPSQDRRMSYSPTTPAFFSSNFLDSLSISTEEDGNSLANQSFVDSVGVHGDGSGYNSHHQHVDATPVSDGASPDFMMVHLDQLAMQSSVSPQRQLQQPSDVCMMDSLPPTMVSAKRQSISKQRRPSTFKPNRTSPPSSPATTMSPSPPVTPSQHINSYDSFHHNHPSIPEEEDDLMKPATSSVETSDEVMERRISAERRAKNSLVSARIVQGANSAQQLKPLIQQYLLSNDPSALGEHSVTLLTGKVAQKSYGTEKRFLCPPPTTILSGASWWTTASADSQDDDDNDDMSTTKFLKSSSSSITGETLCAPKLAIHISGESSSQKGALEWCNGNGSVIDSAPSLSTAAHASILGQTTLSGKCVSKQLHINDADEKRRRVEVLAKIQLGNGLTLGTLASKGIKVISKPSKKRQSTKNTELCIHHGTAVSLFNRIRSQTVSTKYLGVSNGDSSSGKGNSAGTCFVARTTSWDPFVIWIVDTSRSPGSASSTPPQLPHHPLYPDYPPPPAVALQSGISRQSPTAIHYNQSVVLQCVTTGLVSPVMVIRKVDKGSAVFGGNGMEDLSGLTGGECGDEAIGDPVSQLHKIAFQIVQDSSVAYNNKTNNHPRPPPSSPCGWTLPQTAHPVTYLACLNDVVGMHKTTTPRTFVSTRPSPTTLPIPLPPWTPEFSPSQSSFYATHSPDLQPSHTDPAGKMVRKRRVSCDVSKPSAAHPYGGTKSVINSQRRRVNSLNDVSIKTDGGGGRRGSLASDRRTSISSDNGNPVDGNCWTEDVSDAAVWTIMGTESVKYTFWTPPMQQDTTTFNNPFTCPQQSHPITPFPVISQINSPSSTNNTMLISGESMARDLSVWFGDVKAPSTEYKSRELLSCDVPDKADLASSLVAKADDDRPDLFKLPILLVRGDGVVYRTGEFYTFDL